MSLLEADETEGGSVGGNEDQASTAANSRTLVGAASWESRRQHRGRREYRQNGGRIEESQK